MIALAAALVLSAPPSRAPVELPGLERPLRWGMSSGEAAAVVPGFAWLSRDPKSGSGMAGGTATVAGRRATLVLQFGRDHLAVVTVVLDVAPGADWRGDFADVGRALRKRLGRPLAVVNGWKTWRDGKTYPTSTELWRVRGSEITHAYGPADGRPAHVLHLSDVRRPDYGAPAPDYAYRGG